MTQSSAQAYSMELANTLTKITMEKFFKKIHNRFYPDQDVSFMKYFLELTQHECEFIVPHKKLIEYGIMTSTESSAAKKKFAMLNLEKDEDYTLEDVSERGTSGAQTHKVYHLTPEAFKKCLMRAQRRPKQEVDPVIYCDYYLLLEKVFKLYNDYERQYAKCLLALKDDKIDKLLIENQEQSKKIDKLLSHTTHIIIQNDKQSIEIKHLNDKIDILFDYLLSFAHMTIPTWIGSTVIKKQYDTLAKNQTNNYALKHLKVMFMVAFFDPLGETTTETYTMNGTEYTFEGNTRMCIYFCCTNFLNVRARIKALYKKYTYGKNPMYMLKPTVITLISCEINLERIILENSNLFPEKSTSKWNSKFKCFDLIVPAVNYKQVEKVFQSICDKAVSERFQGYQMRINEFSKESEVKIDPKIMQYIDEVDQDFYSSTRPFCQRFIECYVSPKYRKNGNIAEYCFSATDFERTRRSDFNNLSLSETQYTLSSVRRILLTSSKVDHIQIMADQGILSKGDLPALKCMAKYEDIDVSGLQKPDEYDSDQSDV